MPEYKTHLTPWACPPWEAKWFRGWEGGREKERERERNSLPTPPPTIYGTRKLITMFTRESFVPFHSQMNPIWPSHPFFTSILLLSCQPKYVNKKRLSNLISISGLTIHSSCSVFQFTLPSVKIPTTKTHKKKICVESTPIKTSHLVWVGLSG